MDPRRIVRRDWYESCRSAGVADVAARLRAGREEAHLSIEELSARTRIKPGILSALEHGDFEQVPGGEFFARAFVRTYARELHLPVDEMMAEYSSAHPAPVATEPPSPSRPPRADYLQSGAVGWALAALLVGAGILLFALSRGEQPARTELQPVGTMGTSPSVVPSVQQEPGASRTELLTIQIRPTRRLWVTGSVDGKRVLFRTLNAGEEVRLEARETMAFRVGDAGAFQYALNGVPAEPPGRDGEVRAFVIDRSNLREPAR